MAKEGHIFLSYRNIEADFALKLAADLKNAGINLWMDRLDGITVGDEWRLQIANALNNCTAIIAVLSPEYVRSTYCRKELSRADSLNRPIFPVLLSALRVQDWPLELEGVQFVDFTTWQDEKIYQERLSHLIQRIQGQLHLPIRDIPDSETRYLNTLIAELEARKGVLEYVDLAGSVSGNQAEATRPDPRQYDEWASGFSMLVTQSVPAVIDAEPVEKSTLENIREAVHVHPRFVLVGEPGAGKTTSIRHLVLETARSRLANPYNTPLPLLIYLPSWSDESSVEALIKHNWPFDSNVMGLIAQGDVLLCLDGLNEMGAGAAHKVALLRNWLHGKQPPRQAVITCRQQDYAGELNLNLPVVAVAPMNEERIRHFAGNYLQTRAESFLKRIFPDPSEPDTDMSRQLFHLAQNPYLLTALIFVYDNAPDGDLPHNNGALFRGLVQALWAREHTRNTYGWKSHAELEKSFARLAFAMIDEGKPIDVPHDYAQKQIGEAGLLQAARSANLIEEKSGNIRFYHQLIQEYFAAVALQGKSLENVLQEMQFILGKRVAGKWDQVIIALCGITPDANTILAEIARKNPYLAVQTVNSGVQLADTLLRQIVLQILQLWINPNQRMKRAAEDALQSLGSKALPAVIAIWRDPAQPSLKAAAENAIYLVSGNAALPPLVNNLLESPPEVAATALERLREYPSQIMIHVLVQIVQHQKDPVRQKAAQQLQSLRWSPAGIDEQIALAIAARDWNRCLSFGQAAIPHLLEVVHDRSPERRLDATWAMWVMGEIGDPRIIPALREHLNDPDEQHRHAAIQALARFDNDEAASALVKAVADDSFTVRLVAVQTLFNRKWRPTNTQEAIAYFGTLAGAANETVSRTAIEQLNRVPIAHANMVTNYLLPAMQSQRNPDIRREIIPLLARSPNNQFIEMLLQVHREGDSALRAFIIAEIQKIQRQVQKHMMHLVTTRQEPVFRSAAEVLMANSDAPTRRWLAESLLQLLAQNRQNPTAEWALGVLTQSYDASVIRQIMSASSPYLQSVVLPALSRDPSPALIPALEALLNDSNGQIREHAAALLKSKNWKPETTEKAWDQWIAAREWERFKGAGEPVLAKLIPLLADEDEQVRIAVVQLLPQVSDKDIWANLANLLNDPQVAVRREVALAAARYPQSIDRLIPLLDIPQKPVQEAALQSLKQLKEPAVLKLIDDLRNPSWSRRIRAAEALGQIRNPAAVPMLLQLLAQDRQSNVRGAAVTALGQIGDPSAVAEIGRLLQSENQIPKTFILVLNRFGTAEAKELVDHWLRNHHTPKT